MVTPEMGEVSTVAPLAALITSIVSAIGVIFYSVSRFSKLEFKVDTMWAFLLRRAQSELLHKGFGKMNSPLVLTEAGKLAIAPMVSDLSAFYKTLSPKLDDVQVAMYIEQKFGDRLLKEICLPHDFSMGACLVLAVKAAKEPETIKVKKGRKKSGGVR